MKEDLKLRERVDLETYEAMKEDHFRAKEEEWKLEQLRRRKEEEDETKA